MKSFNTIYSRIQDRTGDDSDTMLTIFKDDINQTQELILSAYKWPFLEKTADITTVASTASYELAADFGHMINVKTTPDSGTTYYRPKRVHDPDFWELLQSYNTSECDVPEYYYIEDDNLILYPTYSTVSHTITVRYRRKWVEMTQANYTTGTIVTTTSGGTGVVGTGTPNWAGGLEPYATNLWIRITKAAGASAATGDGRWYEIASITDDENLVLVKNYMGTSIASATAAYTIGEMPYMPGEYHDLLIYRPLAIYYENMEDGRMADRYWGLYDGGYEKGTASRPGGLLGKMIEEQGGMNEFAYHPPQDVTSARSPEVRSLDSISGDSW